MKLSKKLTSKLEKVNDDWFYRDPPTILRPLTVFVWGDALVVLPWIVLCFIAMLINLKVGATLLLVGFSQRFFGEMIYWLLQQFGPKTYRPPDYGLKKLSNNSIYIIYQLTSTFTTALFLTALIFVLMEW